MLEIRMDIGLHEHVVMAMLQVSEEWELSANGPEYKICQTYPQLLYFPKSCEVSIGLCYTITYKLYGVFYNEWLCSFSYLEFNHRRFF